MNTTNLLSNNQASALCGLGVLVGSVVVFNKLSHLAEYALNKTFGDYKNIKKTLDERIIVSIPYGKDYYYIQNIVIGALVAAISSKVVQILVSSYSFPRNIAIPLLISSVAVPIFCTLVNIIVRYTGGHHGRWVELSDAEVSKYGINKDHVEKIGWSARVYCGFGTAPEYFPGEFTEDHSNW